jgi:cephalosporin hydroxylase
VSEHSIHDDSQSDYHQVKNEAAAAMREGVWVNRFQPRFVPWTERELRCDLPREAIDCLSDGKHYISYRGIPMAKDPFDMVLYQHLLFEVKPRTIIELGAYTGASAMWMADLLKTFDCDSHVYAVDIDLTLIDQQAKSHPGTTFIQGDCNQIEQIWPVETLTQLPHPLILIDDAHVNIAGVYAHFHQHGLQPGDYLIIEDTIPWIPGTFGNSESSSDWGDWKWREVQEFLENHAADYRVDRYYTDFFGYNGTWNWNGFLRRMAHSEIGPEGTETAG